MTTRDYYAIALRLTALAAKLQRVQTTAAAAGRPLPANFESLVAQARATSKWIGVELGAQQARQRFRARHG